MISKNAQLNVNGTGLFYPRLINAPASMTEQVEVTGLGDNCKVFDNGLEDVGEFSWEEKYTGVLYHSRWLLKGSTVPFAVKYPDGMTVSFNGNVTKVEADLKPAEEVWLKTTVKIVTELSLDD
jgi:hypothetical protein